MAYNPENFAPHSDWHESVFDMATEAAAIIGIEIDDIRYSGFWSQGDGASFTGSYSYVKGAAAAIRKEWPTATELHAIADSLQKVQRSHFYQLAASITQSGRYSHEMTMSVDVERVDGKEFGTGDYVQGRYIPSDAEESVTEAMRDFARWIYRQLESEYEYQSAWELARGWQDASETAATEKQEARAIVKQLRGTPVGAFAMIHVRQSIRSHLEAMQEALEDRDAIAADFHYFQDGKSIDIATFSRNNF